MDASSTRHAGIGDQLHNVHDAAGKEMTPKQNAKRSNSQPMVLSFVNYQSGENTQNAESRRAVKSHVTKAWHRQKRLAETTKYARNQQRLASASSMTEGVQTRESQHGREVAQPPPRVALSYLEGLIPYSYFAGGGPVLYLKPSKWPFSRPFSMAGASPVETFGKSVFPRQSIWMPNADIPDKVAMKGPLLGGDVLSWISHTPECFKYRVDTIAWIQEQLKSPTTSTSDATIGAIMTLTMWENGDGSSLDPSNHMDGLENIVRLKGGVSTLQQQRMLTKLVMFDYIIAISCARPPRFPHFNPPQPHSPASESNRDGVFAGSPVYGNGDFCDLECNWRREDTIYILRAMWELTDQAIQRIRPGNRYHGLQGRHKTLCPKSEVISYPGGISSGQYSTRIREKMHVFETLHHTALIYERAVTSPHLPFNSPSNYSDLSSLYESLNISVSDPFWLRYPGILLWVLLVGCAVSVKRGERSYFMMFIAKVGIFTEHRWWFESQGAISRFIEVQGMARGR
ncbi:hypothetical protein BKA64DRAFT_305843 [Cadophora sp. MPI-SDFR-AT-0126]|nr:hypothetical protein BKA64DRAFT_305843 [Leotiomycetes sp. MPI-SDFR-AT-0126]